MKMYLTDHFFSFCVAMQDLTLLVRFDASLGAMRWVKQGKNGLLQIGVFRVWQGGNPLLLFARDESLTFRKLDSYEFLCCFRNFVIDNDHLELLTDFF